MKNLIISKSNNMNSNILSPRDQQTALYQQIEYFHELIQKTLLAIQKYKQLDILGANDLNQATHNLESLYVELSNNKILLKK